MKVLISAYACEPGKGSEPGAGWNWALAAARRHDVSVLTRANNRAAIEAALPEASPDGPRFVYLDLPGWARFWKRGQRGARLYYALWQVAAGLAARRLHRAEGFDVVHHLTFANVWAPALAWLAPAPFVLGPVAGGQRVPARLLPSLGPAGAARELSLRAARLAARANPLVRIGWRRAAVVLANNDETREALPRHVRARTVVQSNACAAGGVRARPRPRRARPLAVCPGRLHRFKGVGLALDALARAPAWDLLVVGDGPDRRRLERAALRLGLDGRVRFLPWLERRALWEEVSSADALLLPSLKEGASFVAAEAQALGVPVVALDAGGPAALARAPGACFLLVPPGSPRAVAAGLADALERVARERPAPDPGAFGLPRVAEALDLAYAAASARRLEPLPGEAPA